MEDLNDELFLGLISVIVTARLLNRPPQLSSAIQRFILRRQRRRRLQSRFLQSLQLSHLYFRRRLAARKKRRAWVFPRPQNWFQGLLNDRVIDHWWKENFRVSRGTFEFICQLVGPNMERQNTRMREAIPVDKRVAASLWRLATGECYRSCGLMMGLAKPTVISCCHEFVQELCNFQNEIITFPSARADVIKKVQGFSMKSKVPNVVAAIDGSHIPIKAPLINHEDYFNRKHFYSCLVQGVVDYTGLFLSVAAGFPGSLHDARMLRLTDFYRAAEDEDILMEPTLDLGGTVIRPLVVGDSAYPLKTWLLPVLKDNGALTEDQKKFNKELSKARIISEHAFGLIKGRWRVLLKRLDEDHKRTPDTIVACCVLHNICIMRNEEFDGGHDDSDEDENHSDVGAPTQAARGVLQAVIEHVASQ